MKILVPLDGSEVSEKALEPAAGLARRHGGELLLLRALAPEVPTSQGGALASLALLWKQQEQAGAREYLDRLTLRVQAPHVRALSPIGPVACAIAETARREHCDLLVMTSHGRDGMSRWLLGSVAETTLRHSNCPVLLLRPHSETAADGLFRNVLVPIDGSPASEAVLQRIVPFLAPEGKVTVLQASGLSEKDQYFVPDPALLQEALREMRARLEPLSVPGFEVHHQAVHGLPVQSILERAAELECDLVAMSTHGRGGWKHLLLGSVMERVARRCPCPVLAFPPAQGSPS